MAKNNPVNGQPQKSDEQVKSEARTRVLAEKVFKAISESAKEADGDYTVVEIVDVFLKIVFRYNKIGLDQQFETKK